MLSVTAITLNDYDYTNYYAIAFVIEIMVIHTCSSIGELDKDSWTARYVPRMWLLPCIYVQGLSLLIGQPGGKRHEAIRKSHKKARCAELNIICPFGKLSLPPSWRLLLNSYGLSFSAALLSYLRRSLMAHLSSVQTGKKSSWPSVRGVGMTRGRHNGGVRSLVSVSSLDVCRRERYRDDERWERERWETGRNRETEGNCHSCSWLWAEYQPIWVAAEGFAKKQYADEGVSDSCTLIPCLYTPWWHVEGALDNSENEEPGELVNILKYPKVM